MGITSGFRAGLLGRAPTTAGSWPTLSLFYLVTPSHLLLREEKLRLGKVKGLGQADPVVSHSSRAPEAPTLR